MNYAIIRAKLEIYGGKEYEQGKIIKTGRNGINQ